jgi:hypothetical protein
MKLTIIRPNGTKAVTIEPVTVFTICRMHHLSAEVRNAMTAILPKGGSVESDGFVYSISASVEKPDAFA